MIYKYIKRRKNGKNVEVGVVVALENKNIGYSLCNLSHGDKFNQKKGLEIAIGRAKKHPVTIINVLGVDPSARTECLKMIGRAERYFQGVAL